MYDDGFREEINNVCRESIDDIQFLKQQQWRIVYYCLLLFSVIFFLVRFLIYDYNNPLIFYKKSFQWVLFVLSYGIAFIGLFFLIDIQRAIQKNRIRIANIRRRYFRKETRIRFNLEEQQDIKRYCSFWKDWQYLVTIACTIIVAFGLIFFMISLSLSEVIVFIIPLILFFIVFTKRKK